MDSKKLSPRNPDHLGIVSVLVGHDANLSKEPVIATGNCTSWLRQTGCPSAGLMCRLKANTKVSNFWVQTRKNGCC